MFIVSSKELVAEQCKAGIIGAFPSLNARPESELASWLAYVREAIDAWDRGQPPWPAAPYAVNLIVHPSNARLAHDLDVVCRHEAPIVITSLNPPGDVVRRVHAYGGKVLHDVTTLRHARKAIDAGVDGLILVCAGAGGHTGSINPMAFTDEVRRIFDGLVVLSGCIAGGRQIVAAQAMGADLAYIGTRFIASREANAHDAYKNMVVDATAADIVCSDAVTGLPANYLAKSFEAVGVDIGTLAARERRSFSFGKREDGGEAKAWRDVWSAGQGVGAIDGVASAADIVARLAAEYAEALAGMERLRSQAA
ncbi:nitronate monooxygenase [Pigmentiphaga sp. NML080357]|uniref:NAD(P)H-dependent flavin oxidoreductase n=1 Tax=Pigmentiphaga sp. NML080357 TaxID=2008675 RepID=UPI000B4070D6|nr:nitronate monooxygenase [Pigmentiphaga sp. NML080357]OVZ56872.1 nitronate monooxygenase [Pigmentiphaga sp. NML080357]